MTDLSVILRAEHYDDGDLFQAPWPSMRKTMSQSPTEDPEYHGGEYYADSRYQGRSNKRSPTDLGEDGEHVEGGSKKRRARGRPRVEPKDDTAADRRRTQIRLAQRAYRNRKETAIQTLEKKVNVLQDSNEEMSKAFMHLYDSAVAQGLLAAAPEFGRQLQATTERFVALARQTSEDGSARGAEQGHGHGNESDGANGRSTGRGGRSGDGHRPARSSGSPESTGRLASSSTASRSSGQAGATSATSTGSAASPGQDFAGVAAAPPGGGSYYDASRPVRREPVVPISSASAPFGYRFSKAGHHPPRTAVEVITRATVGNASFPVGTSLGAPPPFDNQSPSTPYALATTAAATDPSSSSLSPSPPPPPPTLPYFLSPHPSLTSAVPAVPSTYSYLERTFGRRLQRAALEQGLVLLHMQSPPPHVYAGVFGFCLLFEPRDKIVRRLSDCIGRGARRTLHNWRHPFFHLGGAGSFFDLVNHEGDARGSSTDSDGHDRFRTSAGGDSDYDDGRPLIGNQGTEGPHKPMRGANFSTGPFLPDVEYARDHRVDARMRITVPGFEGDFFDPDEVEFFLRRKGVYIPPASDFVTAEIDVGDFLVDNPAATEGDPFGPSGAVHFDSTGLGAAATTTGPLDAQLFAAVGIPQPLVDPVIADPFADTAATSTPSLADAIDYNFTALPCADFLFGEPPRSSTMRRSVTLNVETFVHELVMKSVCLGRTPGIRPKDVISAFWAATTDA